MTERRLAVLFVSGLSDVMLEVTDGENVLAQLTRDGTLKLSSRLKVENDDHMRSEQQKEPGSMERKRRVPSFEELLDRVEALEGGWRK